MVVDRALVLTAHQVSQLNVLLAQLPHAQEAGYSEAITDAGTLLLFLSRLLVAQEISESDALRHRAEAHRLMRVIEGGRLLMHELLCDNGLPTVSTRSDSCSSET